MCSVKLLVFALLLCSAVLTPITHAQGDDPPSPVGLDPVLRFTHLSTGDGLANARVEVALHRHLDIRFVYETPTLEAAVSVSLEDLRAAVETLPAAWAGELYNVLVALDYEQMLSLIEAVHPQAPHLSARLAQWVRDFEYDKLMTLIASQD